MVIENVEINNSLTNFINELDKESISLESFYLFGSYAKDTHNEYSDIDIAVVSNDFTGVRYYDNIRLSKPAIKSSDFIETHPFRPEDFTEDNPFVKEILETGIKIV